MYVFMYVCIYVYILSCSEMVMVRRGTHVAAVGWNEHGNLGIGLDSGTHISSKESYISAKEPYISAKAPSRCGGGVERAWQSWCRVR